MERTPPTQLSLYGRDGHRKYLTPAERERFILASLACVRCEVGTLGLFLAYTGCRLSEALAITAGSIDRDECFVAILSLKKRRTDIIREVPLPVPLIERLALLHDLEHLPPGQSLWPWSRGQAWFLIKRVMQIAAIGAGPHATPKGLRHAFAIHGLRSGVPIHLLQRWLGHASLATTAIYAQAIGAEERAFAQLMWTPHRDLGSTVHRPL
jgi:integrase